ncbi:MAG: helix-turn-helix domain-containing protein [Lachnospiraceae bacterium]|nr:helix-turn-helix domain-containing protein [Lachnospiraceae bacterium]
MFDMNKVARNIKEARTKMNMTQMNLADEMGVSYQAVSNWERGNSMPDISKLPELCKILNISFEELVGEKTAETEIAEKLMQEEEAEVTLEEMAKVGHLVKPEQIEDKVNETIEKKGAIPFSTLVGLAPFMDRETLDKLAEELADVDMRKLCSIAPFLAKETLDKIVDKLIKTENLDGKNVISVAPFMAKSTVQKIAEYLISHGQANHLIAIAPFMGKDMFPSSIKNIDLGAGNVRVSVQSTGSKSTNAEAVDLDDLDEDEVAQLAFRALEQGEDVEEYLDYMDEDDVAELARRALKAGKDIAIFLDYMDEDDVKDLLLQVTRK